MIKNLLIGLLTVVSLTSMTYGYLQKARADEQEAIALENMKIAREAESKAEQMQKEAAVQKQIALVHVHQVMEQAELAMKAAANVKSK